MLNKFDLLVHLIYYLCFRIVIFCSFCIFIEVHYILCLFIFCRLLWFELHVLLFAYFDMQQFSVEMRDTCPLQGKLRVVCMAVVTFTFISSPMTFTFFSFCMILLSCLFVFIFTQGLVVMLLVL